MIKIACIAPFQNESEVVSIGGLTIENRLDRVQISGEIDVTKDKQGLASIFEIKRQVDAIAEYLKRESLEDYIPQIDATKEVKNPFK